MVSIINPKLCLKCKGKLLCGLEKCPVYEKLKILREEFKVKRNIVAPSPPFFLISWRNYPNLASGPYLSFSDPLSFKAERAMEMEMGEILRERASSIRPFQIRNVREVVEDGALSIKPVEMSAELKKVPEIKLDFNFMGPSAPAVKIEIEEEPKVPRKVWYYYESYDLKAEEAIFELEEFGFDYLVQLLSTGSLGIKSQRKLVPTRWAITAVDSILSKKYFRGVKKCEAIEKIEIYRAEHWDNNFVIVLFPWDWCFEVLEKWLPGSAWGHGILRDYEIGELKKDYASNITGSYYAARLEILKFLAKRKRKAACLVMREVGPKYYFPVGVWHVRETVKMALNRKGEKFESWKEAKERIKEILKSDLREWEKKSIIIKIFREQKKITDFSKLH